ncbi:tripartite tricarboxylate transporter substrate binding protein [Fusibacter ferrireducens]|uniref:Tripartite tricarboxylate transporter substrate binding protein n=1 Tax=Fusibacter ferrireducens TaxID=2785058 RepID=A0ABR9ZW73_9FIRM|nr:tripartite tricarboxylate transporter substrate binding protein [Fusibacter ferrireducens]MBF4694697.1 tripartite tricarboxylate transporter substrate binding protein [Fusibacter ferrireducens]
MVKKQAFKILCILVCIIVLVSFQKHLDALKTKEAYNDKTGELGHFPNQSIRVIVPYSAGDAADLTTKIVCKAAEKYLKQQIIIEYRPGNEGETGQAFGAKAPADGYTLTIVDPSTLINPLTKEVAYTSESFAYIVNMCTDNQILFVKKNAPYDTLEAFMDYANKHPGEVRIGNVGSLNMDHLSVMMIESELNLKFAHVTFEEKVIAEEALLAGHIDGLIANPADLFERYKSKDIKAIALMSTARDKDFPDVPTFVELGYYFVTGPFRAIAVPKETPDEVIHILEEAFLKALESDEVKEAFSDVGIAKDTYLNSEKITQHVKELESNYVKLIEKYQSE